jgi:hypothetical protein
MPSANDYFKMAEECYRLANEAKTEVDRLACLDLARTWLEAAAQQDEAEKRTRVAAEAEALKHDPEKWGKDHVSQQPKRNSKSS